MASVPNVPTRTTPLQEEKNTESLSGVGLGSLPMSTPRTPAHRGSISLSSTPIKTVENSSLVFISSFYNKWIQDARQNHSVLCATDDGKVTMAKIKGRKQKWGIESTGDGCFYFRAPNGAFLNVLSLRRHHQQSRVLATGKIAAKWSIEKAGNGSFYVSMALLFYSNIYFLIFTSVLDGSVDLDCTT